jgi:23S rRNA (uracil1939-C5)-methyltransferase
MVSCNPATFARDLAILMSGGFTIRRITPVDQFLWSSHLEVVAQLSR